eukprot:scaffold22459_cov54-Attheya_sp.AAC.2
MGVLRSSMRWDAWLDKVEARSLGRGIRKSVVDSTAGSGDSTITADCGRGQGWGGADGEGGYQSTECIRADGAAVRSPPAVAGVKA